jgi:hypothetical protein
MVRCVIDEIAGDFLLLGEAADYCHVYDCHSDFSTYQDINFFGEVAGVDISEDDGKLFIGVTDNAYGIARTYCDSAEFRSQIDLSFSG